SRLLVKPAAEIGIAQRKIYRLIASLLCCHGRGRWISRGGGAELRGWFCNRVLASGQHAFQGGEHASLLLLWGMPSVVCIGGSLGGLVLMRAATEAPWRRRGCSTQR